MSFLLSFFLGLWQQHHFLFSFCFGISLDKKFFAGKGVGSGPVHEAGIGGWCRGENLHLFRSDFQLLADELSQFQHMVHGAARVGRDQVIGEKLLFAGFPGKAVKFFLERQQQINRGLAHFLQDFGLTVFRSDF